VTKFLNLTGRGLDALVELPLPLLYELNLVFGVANGAATLLHGGLLGK
jgi:hypothetical protein